MKRRFLLSFAALLVIPHLAFAATPTWTQTLSGPVDGASYGDVDGDGTYEIGVMVRGEPGEVVLMSSHGAPCSGHTPLRPR